MNMCVSQTIDHIEIKIKVPKHSQEPPASSKSPIENSKDMDSLCTFKIRIESQNLEYGLSKTSDHIQIKIKIPNPSQEPLASFKAPNQDWKEFDVLWTFKIKIESQNLEQLFIKDQ